ncbi:MAG: cupin domain-containing protein [Aquabacterium sp.]|nr:cupin domain-containing protein [Ferruginibacter sp.]
MNNNLTLQMLVQKYHLVPHPEGGYFKEHYRSAEVISNACLPKRFDGDRCYSTAIYFLLGEGNFSAFHKIQSDECWHFYAGQTLWIHVIHLNGKLETIKLGSDIANGNQFQAVVAAGCWFASEPAPGTQFAFTGCTVAPGFDFNDFELAKKEELVKHYPQHSPLINRLCR